MARQLPTIPGPAGKLLSRGVPDRLKGTVKATGTKPAKPAAADAGVIHDRRVLQYGAAAADALTAGAMDVDTPSTPPSNSQLEKLGVRDVLVPRKGVHVP